MHLLQYIIFKTQKSKKFLKKFHKIFEDLIGLDNLKLLQASSLNFNKGYLISPHAKILHNKKALEFVYVHLRTVSKY